MDSEGRAGVDAVVRLSKGDMRRALNLVQTMSVWQRVTAAEVYACTGPGCSREVRGSPRLLGLLAVH